ncbi:protein DEHYDRATION-INDUCED 19 isoform X1 [Cryptomeria japonica]|uniref:protein DEHYDRATION-INDUCED 19 isoform X1 n=1 Tax=Cryptomeria japonica TaxID=3369 RepID=UPI0025AC8A03|nr:protein DEHYDRATION-INDUCED 19 isoform X1 [Cryptomeria japonica]
MDEEIGSACIKRHQGNQLVADRLMTLEGLEEEDEEIRQDLSCPFCYKDFDADTLCHHLQDEHCFQANRKQVCPICTAKIEKDMLEHITRQHGYMFKTQRRTSHNEGIPLNRKLSFLGKNPHEGVHRSSHKGTSAGAGFNTPSATLDPLLSSFVYSMPNCEAKKQPERSLSSEESLTKNCAASSSSSVQVITSSESSHTLQNQEQTTDELSGKVNFVQHLVLSTILGDEF